MGSKSGRFAEALNLYPGHSLCLTALTAQINGRIVKTCVIPINNNVSTSSEFFNEREINSGEFILQSSNFLWTQYLSLSQLFLCAIRSAKLFSLP